MLMAAVVRRSKLLQGRKRCKDELEKRSDKIQKSWRRKF
jgi:hypothetical protein